MLFTLITNLSQQNLRKLATKGVFTVDKRFSDRFPLKISRQFEPIFCSFYHQSDLVKKQNDRSRIVMNKLLNFEKMFFYIYCIEKSDSVKIIIQSFFSMILIKMHFFTFSWSALSKFNIMLTKIMLLLDMICNIRLL